MVSAAREIPALTTTMTMIVREKWNACPKDRQGMGDLAVGKLHLRSGVGGVHSMTEIQL